MKNSTIYFLGLIILFMISCKEEEPEIQPDESFLKIYNNEGFETVYTPIDFVQSADSSYFILGSYDYKNTYVLKTDKFGKYLWDFEMDENYVNPIPGVFEANSNYYFFCMDELSLQTLLFQVSDSSSAPQLVQTFGRSFPLHASQNSQGETLLLSYDYDEQASRLDIINANFGLVEGNTYPVQDDYLEYIDGHINRTGTRLPFFTGESDGRYFFNGFSNYTLSVHFVNKNDFSQTGVISGFQEGDEAVSGLLNISGNNYLLSRYSFNENFIIPNSAINENSTMTSTDFTGNDHPEITQRAFFHHALLDVNGTSVIASATSTKSGQAILYFYNSNSGELLGSKRLGYNNPYESVKIVQSLDGGLTILGNTYITGRFSRIYLYKLSQQDVINATNN